MAKVKMRYWGEQGLFDLFGSDYVLAESSKTKLVFEMTDGGGEVTRIIAVGDGFVAKDGMLTKGSITRVQLQNDEQKSYVDMSALDVGANLFHSLLADGDVWSLMELLFSGHDKISSSAFSTQFFTGSGNDVVRFTGQSYAEFIDGRGNDTYIGSTLNADIENTLSYADADIDQTGIKADFQKGVIVDPWGTKDTVKNINALIGTMHDDVVKSSADDAWMKFTGQDGADTFVGNSKLDTIVYRGELSLGGMPGVTVNLAEGKATDSFGKTDTLSGIERVLATVGNDTIIGSARKEQFEGWTGDDTMTGGGGADVFRFRDDWGVDTITDFEVGVDKIRMNDVSDLFDGVDGLSIVQDGENTVITLVDDDTYSITLLNIVASSLSESDFIV